MIPIPGEEYTSSDFNLPPSFIENSIQNNSRKVTPAHYNVRKIDLNIEEEEKENHSLKQYRSPRFIEQEK